MPAWNTVISSTIVVTALVFGAARVSCCSAKLGKFSQHQRIVHVLLDPYIANTRDLLYIRHMKRPATCAQSNTCRLLNILMP